MESATPMAAPSAAVAPQTKEPAAEVAASAPPTAPDTTHAAAAAAPSSNNTAFPRPSSYILLSNSARALSDYDNDDDNDEVDHNDNDDPPSGGNTSDQLRPRFFFVLPALAVLDLAITCFVGFTVLGKERDRQDGSMGLTATIMASAALRDSVFAIVGVSRNIRNLSITVAAISLSSMLFTISVFNLVVQARGVGEDDPSPPSPTSSMLIPSYTMTATHSISTFPTSQRITPKDAHAWLPLPYQKPTLTLLATLQLAVTLIQWISYIAVVGVRVPPGGNPIKAQRWIQALAQGEISVDDLRARSIYDVDEEANYDSQEEEEGDEEEEEEDEQGGEGLDEGQEAGGSSEVATAAEHSHLLSSSPAGRSLRQRSSLTSLRSTHHPTSQFLAPLSAPIILDDEEHDPNDIVDITPDRRVSRQISRRRLAIAADPERRRSGAWSIAPISSHQHNFPTIPDRGSSVAGHGAGRTNDSGLSPSASGSAYGRSPVRTPKTSLSRLASVLSPGARDRRRKESTKSAQAAYGTFDQAGGTAR